MILFFNQVPCFSIKYPPPPPKHLHPQTSPSLNGFLTCFNTLPPPEALLQHRPLPEVPGPGEELLNHPLAESALRSATSYAFVQPSPLLLLFTPPHPHHMSQTLSVEQKNHAPHAKISFSCEAKLLHMTSNFSPQDNISCPV